MQAEHDDDLHLGQRSSEVKCSKLRAMATKLGQKNPWYKFMIMTFMGVKGHQRSNVINYVLWLPNLVRRIPDASLWWWWPAWRSKVIRGQMWWTMFCGYQTWSEESLMQVYDDDDDLHGGQRSPEVKGSKLCAMVSKLRRIPDASLKWGWP